MSFLSGACLNCADLGRLLHVSPPTALAYIRELEAIGLVRRIPFYWAGAQGTPVRRPKLIAWEDPSPRATLLQRLAQLRPECRLYWWKCARTREIDLVADLGDERVGFCFAPAEPPRRRDWLPLVRALDARVIDRAFLLHKGRRAYRTEPPLRGPVLALPADRFLQQLKRWMFEWRAPRQVWQAMRGLNRHAAALDKLPASPGLTKPTVRPPIGRKGNPATNGSTRLQANRETQGHGQRAVLHRVGPARPRRDLA